MADNKARLAELRDKKTQGQLTDENEVTELQRLENESKESEKVQK